MIHEINAATVPIRAAKFIQDKSCIICGADDGFLRMYDLNTMEYYFGEHCHNDYIRSIIIHPQTSLIIYCDDAFHIKAFKISKPDPELNKEHVTDQDDGDKLGSHELVLQKLPPFAAEHVHYVMALAFNPKDPKMFASGSLDKCIKIWNIDKIDSIATLEGHKMGIDSIAFHEGEEPYLVSGADDTTVRLWDYEKRECLQIFHGHNHNVCAVLFHPYYPMIVSGSEDHKLNVWDIKDEKLIQSMDCGKDMMRIWCMKFVDNVGFVENNVTKKLKGDDKSVLVVAGFIKMMQNKLEIQLIPEYVVDICLRFYHGIAQLVLGCDEGMLMIELQN